MMRRLCLIVMSALPSVASACMVCDTELGHQVQRGVFDGNFTQTAVAVLLPFPLFILAGALLCDHQLLNLHHVYEAQGQSKFDYLFLLSGVVFIVGGLMAIRSQRDVTLAETQLR